MIRFIHHGDFKNTERFLSRAKNLKFNQIVQRYGDMGLEALRRNTPKDTGITSDSWGYEVTRRRDGFSLTWTNSHLVDGIPVVILLQYGHGTRGGTYVEGRDFINPAMKPIFDMIAESIWKEVSNL